MTRVRRALIRTMKDPTHVKLANLDNSQIKKEVQYAAYALLAFTKTNLEVDNANNVSKGHTKIIKVKHRVLLVQEENIKTNNNKRIAKIVYQVLTPPTDNPRHITAVARTVKLVNINNKVHNRLVMHALKVHTGIPRKAPQSKIVKIVQQEGTEILLLPKE